MEFGQYVKKFFIKGIIWAGIFWIICQILYFFIKPEIKETEPYWKGVDPTKSSSDALFDYNTGQVTYREYVKEDSTESKSEFEYPDLEGEIDIESEIDLIID